MMGEERRMHDVNSPPHLREKADDSLFYTAGPEGVSAAGLAGCWWGC